MNEYKLTWNIEVRIKCTCGLYKGVWVCDPLLWIAESCY